MMAAISGVRPNTPLWDKLQKDECKMLVEFYRRVDKIMCLKTTREAIHVGKSAPVEKNNDNGKKLKKKTATHLQTKQTRSPKL